MNLFRCNIYIYEELGPKTALSTKSRAKKAKLSDDGRDAYAVGMGNQAASGAIPNTMMAARSSIDLVYAAVPSNSAG